MVSCEGCGGQIDADARECPYCGRSVIQRVEDKKKPFESLERTYRVSTDEEGSTHIQFGDGQTGSRLPSGSSSVSGRYRQGAGAQGNVGSRLLEEKLDEIERIPNPLKHKESKDLGVSLLESMSAIGDLTSLYQSGVSREAHLSTDGREGLSKKEEGVRPKLKAIIDYCDKVDSKTKKKIGLSDSEVHNIRKTAARALQMINAGRCAKCGTVNKPGIKQCQNCGANL